MPISPAAQARLDQMMTEANHELSRWVQTVRRCQARRGTEQGLADAWALLMSRTEPKIRDGLLVAALRRMAEGER
jgi:hypothetical protein